MGICRFKLGIGKIHMVSTILIGYSIIVLIPLVWKIIGYSRKIMG